MNPMLLFSMIFLTFSDASLTQEPIKNPCSTGYYPSAIGSCLAYPAGTYGSEYYLDHACSPCDSGEYNPAEGQA